MSRPALAQAEASPPRDTYDARLYVPGRSFRVTSRALAKRDSWLCSFCGGRWGSFESLDGHTRAAHQGQAGMVAP